MLSDVNVKYILLPNFYTAKYSARCKEATRGFKIIVLFLFVVVEKLFSTTRKKAVWLRETNIVHPCTSPQIAV